LSREKLLTDPYRPGYHFAIPDGIGWPGDSNGAFFADGTYHLMYLYRNHDTNAYHWGHMSSRDLLHWRHHMDCLTGLEGDEGCYSGGAFVDDDGTAYLTFWKFPAKKPGGDRGGIAIASARPPYEKWERITPIAVEHTRWGVIEIERDGKIHPVSCADPSNIWKMNGRYYMQTGNLLVLNNFGREADSPEKYKGGWTDLFKSEDLRTWTYVHRFYVDPNRGVDDWPDETEDDMCPSFLPLADKKSSGNLTDKWLQCFISHNKGAQYYIGELKGETFYPEQHGRFSWKDSAYFAPEALVDDKNRQISWSWLRDNMEGDYEKYGWTGTFSFPRLFWYEGGILRMAPAEELDRLQING
jgi:beta-fructofuranosidase